MTIVKMDQVTKNSEMSQQLDRVSLEIREGEIFGRWAPMVQV